MNPNTYIFLSKIRVEVIKKKPSINAGDKKDLNKLKKIFESNDPLYNNVNILDDINKCLGKPFIISKKMN